MGHARETHDHAGAAGAPGASAPGEPGYEGEVTIGDDAAASPLDQYDSPFGRPDEQPDDPEDVPPDVRARVEAVDRLLEEGGGSG
jgi:hypothetical protein